MDDKKNSRIKLLWLSVIFLIAIICKYYQFIMLPSKYFIDSNKILLMIQYPNIVRSLSYIVTANFFRIINIFGFSTLFEWSIAITVIYNLIFFIMLYMYKKFNTFELIFIYISMAILDIFSLNLGKEVIQIFVFMLIYLILINNKFSNKKKICFINIILLMETIFFREYYILVLFGFNLIYWCLNRKWPKKVFEKICMILFLFLLALFLSKSIMPNYYNKLIEIRTINEKNLAEANTLIRNIIPNNTNSFIYCINYAINFIRIMCPVEIVSKGLKYMMFTGYQFIITYIICNSLRAKDSRNYLVLSVVLGYFLASVAFEPDFGSVIRHESTIFLIILLLKKYDMVLKK